MESFLEEQQMLMPTIQMIAAYLQIILTNRLIWRRLSLLLIMEWALWSPIRKVNKLDLLECHLMESKETALHYTKTGQALYLEPSRATILLNLRGIIASFPPRSSLRALLSQPLTQKRRRNRTQTTGQNPEEIVMTLKKKIPTIILMIVNLLQQRKPTKAKRTKNPKKIGAIVRAT